MEAQEVVKVDVGPPVVAVEQPAVAVPRRVRVAGPALVVASLIVSDLALALAFGLAGGSRWPALAGGMFAEALLGAGPYVVVWLGMRAALGLYPGYGMGHAEELRRQTFAAGASFLVVVALGFGWGGVFYPVLPYLWAIGLLFAAPVARYFSKLALARARVWGKPVFVVGAGPAGRRVLGALRQEWQLGLSPVGVFDDREMPPGGAIDGVPYGGTLEDAVARAGKGEVDTAIFAMPHTRRERLLGPVQRAGKAFRHVVVIPNLDGITSSVVVARDLGGTFGVEMKHNLLDPWCQRFKRVIDLAALLTGGLLAVPLLLGLALLVWAESGGPVLYRDRRLGKDGRHFACVKFRTMVPDAEVLLQRLLEEDEGMRSEYLRYHKLKDDPRVTRVGRLLRRTSLDELPQLWNVLMGEMSLVGPRPYLPRESGDIGMMQGEILRAVPGITGPWQVTGRNHTSFAERVSMDARYVRDWSVWLDIVLLARTARCLVSSRNAY